VASERNLRTPSTVRTNIEEVQQVLEQSIPKTPRFIENVILEDDKEEKEKERDLVSTASVTIATVHLCHRLPNALYCHLFDAKGKKRKQPVFSPKSLETEFSSDSETSYSLCSPFFAKDINTCATNADPMKHKVVLIHLSSDYEGDVVVD